MANLQVLHVIPSVAASDGGPSRAIAVMERALVKEGVSVTTLTTDHGLETPMPLGAPVLTEFPRVARIYERKWGNFYKVAPGIVTQLWKHIQNFDVVHVHGLFSFAPNIAAIMARRAGVPYIVRPLGSLSSYGMTRRRRRLKQLSMSLVEGPVIQNAAAVHFTSQAEQTEAEGLGFTFKGIVIPLGIEPAPSRHQSRPYLADLYPCLKAKRVVLFLSRLDPKKNLEALVDAVAGSERLRQGCALLIAGSGDPSYVTNLKERVARAGLADQIIWLGHIEGQVKAAAFATADVFVLPSFSENFGIAAAEALFCGLPCVLGRGVAIAEEIERAGAAIAVSPDSVALAGALECVLADDSLRRRMGEKARVFAEQEYSMHTMGWRLRMLYEDVNRRKVPR